MLWRLTTFTVGVVAPHKYGTICIKCTTMGFTCRYVKHLYSFYQFIETYFCFGRTVRPFVQLMQMKVYFLLHYHERRISQYHKFGHLPSKSRRLRTQTHKRLISPQKGSIRLGYAQKCQQLRDLATRSCYSHKKILYHPELEQLYDNLHMQLE
jgi:hypothetical protein